MFGKLRIQLLSIFLLFGLINISIIVICNLSSFRKEQIESIEEQIHRIELLIFMDAQQINNFFTYDTKSSDFFLTHKSHYLSQHQNLISNCKGEVEDLLSLKDPFSKKNKVAILKIASSLDSMALVTDSIMNIIYFRGFKDFGIEGEMRKSAHALETTKGVDLADLLMLRRHEKDYIIRNEVKYISKFHERVALMKKNINESKTLSEKEKLLISANLDKYQELFVKMVDVDRLAGVKDNTALKARLDFIINSLVSDSEKLKTYCREYKLESYKRIRNISGVLLLVVIAISVFLSFKLSKKVTNRISLLSDNISNFIGNCFSENTPLKITHRDDEVGMLIKNIESLKLKIHDQLNYLELKVQERTEEINIQKEHILVQNKRFMDSLKSALSIQEAMLPDKNYISQTFPEHFIYYRPKDLVSGDFYWFKRIQNEDFDISVIAIVDCTGHGVPGAFMSMLGMALLNDIIFKKDVYTSANILNKLRKNVINTIAHQHNSIKVSDGMDVALTIVDHTNKRIQFSGANRSLVRIRNNSLEVIKGDRMPIGKFLKEEIDFSNTEMDFQDNDIIYMFTDGFADQFGGNDNSKFTGKKLLQLLLEISHLTMKEQKQRIDSELNGWMKNNNQTDDILVAGFKLNI